MGRVFECAPTDYRWKTRLEEREMELGLRGKRVLVTGASQGIGRKIAETFAEEGAILHLTARNADRLAALAAELRGKNGVEVSIHPADLTGPDAPIRLASEVGDIDILVNNAGAIPGGDLFSSSDASWRANWDLKVFGYINLTRAVYARMKTAGTGAIVNVIGNAGERYDAEYIAGTTGNAALMAFTRALGGRSLDDGIRVVGVNPGPVDTDRIRTILKRKALDRFGDEARWQDFLAGLPLGRFARVEEVADLVVFLASGRSAYTTGAIFTIDGGIASRNSIA